MVSTGIAELDDILQGDLAARCAHLIEARAGSGKTTVAIQFLREGEIA